MTENIQDYMTTRQAADEIGVLYETFKKRLRQGKVNAKRVGWNYLIHKDEVKRLKKQEKQNATNKNMGKGTR